MSPLLRALTQKHKRRAINWALSKAIFDGDSLMASHPANVNDRIPARVTALLGAGASAMLAIGGQTIQDMIDNASDVDAAYDASKQFNVLFTFAGTNGMIDGAATQAARMQTYIAARKAAHPSLLVVLGGLIPRYETSAISIDERNNRMVEYNSMAAAGWRAWGADAYVDLRPKGGPFDLPDWTEASFIRPQTLPLWTTADTPPTHTHLSEIGANYCAPLLVAGARRL